MNTITNTLSLNLSYLVIFEKTGQPYITEEGDAIVYLRPEDADIFLKSHPGSILDRPQFYKSEELCSTCFGAGAERIRVTMPRREQERYEDLKKMPIRKYYNHSLNKNLNLLHETKKSEYLYRLKGSRFIVPVKIQNAPCIKIEYSIASIGDKNYFIAFSNTDEYDHWSEKITGYEALEVSFDELVELSDRDDVLINVYGARYVLSNDKIQKIVQKQNNDS